MARILPSVMADDLKGPPPSKVANFLKHLPGVQTEGMPKPPLRLLNLSQLREASQAVTWLVKHAIPGNSIGLLFGGSGTFKSFIALDLALHVAHGLQWLGRKTKKGPVLIVAAEGGAGLWRRIVAWHRRMGRSYDGVPVYVLPMSIDLMTDAARLTDAVSALAFIPELIVIDTLSQTFSGEENSSNEIAAYLRELGLWFRDSWRCTVLVVHHTGHLETERPRGSSALRSNVDFMFGVFRDEAERMATMENQKQKDGECIDPITFSMELEHLSYDEDGDAVTSLAASCVAQSDALNLMRFEAERGRGGRNQLFLSMALDGMDEKKLRQVFYDAIDGDGEKKRQAYGRARKWAIKSGLIEVAEGYILKLNRDT